MFQELDFETSQLGTLDRCWPLVKILCQWTNGVSKVLRRSYRRYGTLWMIASYMCYMIRLMCVYINTYCQSVFLIPHSCLQYY